MKCALIIVSIIILGSGFSHAARRSREKKNGLSQVEHCQIETSQAGNAAQDEDEIMSHGGPDSFGYIWKDSDESGGASYDWIEISSTGTHVYGLYDDNYVGPFPIGFSFPYYGNSYSQFYIQSNGVINFLPSYFSLSNRYIPLSDGYNNGIAWFWDDLYPTGSVYYRCYSDKLVIEFVNYGQYYTWGYINAEVILYSNGTIKIQYKDSGGGFYLNSCTIGIENSDGTDGLRAAYNSSYVHNNLAVQFSLPAPSYDLFVRTNYTTSQDKDLTVACAWGDYNGDGTEDLFVANTGGGDNILYSNPGDVPFNRITAQPVAEDGGKSSGACWADYDNDGDPDLFVANLGDENNFLYRNNGDGTFQKIDNGPVVNDGGDSNGAAWGDYDADGWVDLFVANKGQDNFLYHNNGNGTFTRITAGNVVTDGGASTGGSWCDYDLDGDLDLFVANTGLQTNFLYNNNGDGTFTRITSGAIVEDGFESYGASWGDYNGDGYPDLYVPHSGQNNCLYRNNMNGTFLKITYGDLVKDGLRSKSSGWGDVDKDGDLDLFVSNSDAESHIHLNNGDGTFTRYSIFDPINGWGGAWCDYNSDGNLDLFLCNYGSSNVLLGNTYDANNWLKVKCTGTISNKSGIGAKVKIKVNNKWQSREISSQTGFGGQNSLIAYFGLGSAATVDQVKVIWPSGIVNNFYNVTGNQTMTVTESDPIPNQFPVAVDDSVTLDQDCTQTLHVLSNDSDPDGHSMRIQAIDITGILGIVQIDPGDTTLTYTAPKDYSGWDCFSYCVTDDHGGLDTALVSIEILPGNRPPAALNDTLSIQRDNIISVFPLINDSDPDGDPLRINSILDAGTAGTVVVNSGDTSVTYIPFAGFLGDDVFDYVVSDGKSETDTASVFIMVRIGNRAPVAVNDTVSIVQDSVVTICSLMNDSDPDGDELIITEILEEGVAGTIFVNSGDTSLTYVPPAGFNGDIDFDYVVSDGNGGLDTATVFITVIPVSAVSDQPVPVSFGLLQNYPNPFNPVTTISYALPEKSRVILRIFSVTGSEICTLVNEEESSGKYEVTWNARDRFGKPVSSGIYFYRLEAGEYTKIRKMLLVR